MKKLRVWALLAAASGAAAAFAVGCGGDDTAVSGDASPDGPGGGGDGSTKGDGSAQGDGSSGDDGSVQDTSTGDTGSDVKGSDASDGGGGDANGSDASDGGADADAGPTPCSPNGSSCTTSGSQAGICQSSLCMPCVDPTTVDAGAGDAGPNGDMACTTAYGGDAGTSYVCNAGSCVAGNCHTSATCNGEVCTANKCTACTMDTQCANDPVHPNTVCKTAGDAGVGTCVSNACNTLNTACPQNASDFCCVGASGDQCFTGNCCDNSQCASVSGSPACIGHSCTSCDAISGNTYYVDPVNGSDSVGNGSGMAGGQASSVCKFKTVHKALQTIGSSPAAGTKIIVLGGSTADATEVFPWDIPVNTAISSSSTAVSVSVASGTAVTMTHASSSIDGFSFDGASTATRGFVVTAGASNPAATASTKITNVSVKNFTENGFRVESGGVTLGGKTVADGSKSTGAESGLYATGTGVVVVDGSDAASSITFSNNGAGIFVDSTAQLTVTGVVTSGSSNVVMTKNTRFGVAVRQDATAGQPPLVSLSNIESANSTAVGIGLWGGSNVKVRGSILVGNDTGVSIQGYCSGNGPNGTSVSCGSTPTWSQATGDLDLGKNATTGAGHNVLQDTTTGNTSVGLCYSIGPNQSQNLWAAGNQWVTSGPTNVDCSSASGTLTSSPSCSGGASWGGSGKNGNTINVQGCSP